MGGWTLEGGGGGLLTLPRSPPKLPKICCYFLVATTQIQRFGAVFWAKWESRGGGGHTAAPQHFAQPPASIQRRKRSFFGFELG